MRAKARAHTNIALIKYWGKRDETLFLPTNNSLSMTLDQFYTETMVEFDSSLQKDQFILDGTKMDQAETQKVSLFMDKVRRYTGESRYAQIDSVNHVPTAAGFASSASGYAALAAAAMKATGVSFSEQDLSKMARQGSGSASRSIYGGFVEWQKGEKADGSDCFAVPVLEQGAWDLRVLSVEVTHEVKKVLSREGMKRTVETSPFFAGWLEAVAADLVEAKTAISRRDFTHLGETLERNALRMHATTLGANPPFMYWQSSTVQVMEAVQALRDEGIEAYFTIDAGPNVKVVCQPEYEQQIFDTLMKLNVVQTIYRCKIGPGVSYLEI